MVMLHAESRIDHLSLVGHSVDPGHDLLQPALQRRHPGRQGRKWKMPHYVAQVPTTAQSGYGAMACVCIRASVVQQPNKTDEVYKDEAIEL